MVSFSHASDDADCFVFSDRHHQVQWLIGQQLVGDGLLD